MSTKNATFVQESRARSAGVYFGSQLLSVIVGAVQLLTLTPIVLSLVSKPVYGAWLACLDIFALGTFFDFGIINYSIRAMSTAHAKNNKSDFYVSFVTSTAVFVVLSIIVSMLMFGLIKVSPALFHINDAHINGLQGSLCIAALASTCSVIGHIPYSFARSVQNCSFIGKWQVAGSIVGFIIAGLLLFAIELKLYALAWGYLVRSLIPCIGGFLFVKKYIGDERILKKEYFSSEFFKGFLKQSASSFIVGAGHNFLFYVDTFLFAILLRPEVALVYNMTKRLAEFIRLVIEYFNSSVLGSFSHLVNSDRSATSLTVFFELLHLLLLLGTCSLSYYILLNQHFVSSWIGGDLYGGSMLSILIAMNVLVTMASALFVRLCYFSGYTGIAVKLAAFEIFSRLLSTFFLARWFELNILLAVNILISMLVMGLAYSALVRQLKHVAGTTSVLAGTNYLWGYLTLMLSAMLLILLVRANIIVTGVSLFVVAIFAFCMIKKNPHLGRLNSKINLLLSKLSLGKRCAP